MRRGRCQRRSTFQTVTDQTVSPAGAALGAPRCPRGAWSPGSPLLPRRNLMQTHFDRGFLAGLDLPTEKKKFEKHTQKNTHPLQKNKPTTTRRVCTEGAKNGHSLGGRDERVLSPPQTPGREEMRSPSLLFSVKYNTHSDRRAFRQSQLIDRHIELLSCLTFYSSSSRQRHPDNYK